MRTPGALCLRTEELIRAGDSLRALFSEHKISPSPCVRNQTGKIGNWHDWAEKKKKKGNVCICSALKNKTKEKRNTMFAFSGNS